MSCEQLSLRHKQRDDERDADGISISDAFIGIRSLAGDIHAQLMTLVTADGAWILNLHDSVINVHRDLFNEMRELLPILGNVYHGLKWLELVPERAALFKTHVLVAFLTNAVLLFDHIQETLSEGQLQSLGDDRPFWGPLTQFSKAWTLQDRLLDRGSFNDASHICAELDALLSEVLERNAFPSGFLKSCIDDAFKLKDAEQSTLADMPGFWQLLLPVRKSRLKHLLRSNAPISSSWQWLCRLCEHCQVLDFGALRCPTFGELEHMTAVSGTPTPRHFDANTHFPAWKPLGTLRRMKESSGSCISCKLLWDTIVYYHFGREPELFWPPAGRDVQCSSYVQYFATFTDPGDPDGGIDTKSYHNNVRRLSLRLGVPPAAHQDDADVEYREVMFCIQATGDFGTSGAPMAGFMDPAPTACAFGGRARPLTLDLSWVSQWLQICHEHHGSQCKSAKHAAEYLLATSDRLLLSAEKDESTHIFRLIDVQEACLEEFVGLSTHYKRSIPRYVALSYMWGKDQNVKLTSNNRSALTIPGAFHRQRPNRTVLDAIQVVAKLNLESVRYLWVDALCIIQDNEVDKAQQIRRMGQTYAEAYLTIVASTGEDADAGLPGFREGSRSMQQRSVQIVPPGSSTFGDGGVMSHEFGLSFMTTLNPLSDWEEEYWTIGRYAKRGWTLQERFLSTRKLIFTDEQVYWVCPFTTYCEESHWESSLSRLQTTYSGSEHAEPALSKLSQQLENNEAVVWGNMSALGTIFSNMDFSNEGDACDAFSGIEQAATALTGNKFLWGTPTTRFELGLLWIDGHYLVRRMASTTLPVTSMKLHLRIPSWSWLGWRNVGLNLVASTAMIPELLCYVHEPGGQLLTQVNNTCSTDSSSFPFRDSQDDEALRRGWEASLDRCVNMEHVAQALPHLYKDLPVIPESTILFFWTSTLTLLVHKDVDRPMILGRIPCTSDTSKKWQLDKMDINGTDYYWIGELITGGCSQWNETLSSGHQNGNTWDFIVVGRSKLSDGQALLALMVGYRDGERGSVAHRAAIGRFIEDAWVANKPQWRLIALG